MASTVTFCAYVVRLIILVTSLLFRTVQSIVTVTVSNLTAYSATMRWEIDIPQYSNLTGFRLTNAGDFAMNMNTTINNVSSRMYRLSGLDDLRGYNACVATLVPAPEVPEVGCAQFSTPMGSTTSVAIVAGVFLVLCLVTFAILDFVVAKGRNRDIAYKQEVLLEQGWQTFQRHSNKKGKGRKKKNAPGRPVAEAPGPEAPGPEAPGPEAPGPEAPGPEAPGPEAPGPRDEPDGEEPTPMNADLSNNI